MLRSIVAVSYRLILGLLTVHVSSDRILAFENSKSYGSDQDKKSFKIIWLLYFYKPNLSTLVVQKEVY